MTDPNNTKQVLAYETQSVDLEWGTEWVMGVMYVLKDWITFNHEFDMIYIDVNLCWRKPRTSTMSSNNINSVKNYSLNVKCARENNV